MQVYLTRNDQVVAERKVLREYDFGNWGGIEFSYLGKRYKAIPDSCPIEPSRCEVDLDRLLLNKYY